MWLSVDRHWKVTVIRKNGTELFRVQSDRMVLPDEATSERTGPVLMAGGWYLKAEVSRVEDIARYVPLDQLQEVK